MRGWIYDATLPPLTSQWYRTVLKRLAEGTDVLDVGIGTGAALARNADLVRARELRITGVDIDPGYLKRCRRLLARRDLETCVELVNESIYDHHAGPYDAVYFSASFMLLPDPVGALRHVQYLLRPTGQIYLTQTFQDVPSALLELCKPRLHRLTTIDFGTVTYEAHFREMVHSAGLMLEELTMLSRSRTRSGRLAVVSPPAGPLPSGDQPHGRTSAAPF